MILIALFKQLGSQILFLLLQSTAFYHNSAKQIRGGKESNEHIYPKKEN